MPAQSGSTAVLKAMRRGYTREAYNALIDRVRSYIPEVRHTYLLRGRGHMQSILALI